MKVDFSQTFKDFDGSVLKQTDSETGKKTDKDLTLRHICIEALKFTYADEPNLSGEEKCKRFDLAMVIYGATAELDFISDDVALIKKLVAKAYSVLIVAQAWNMLEGKNPYRFGEKDTE